MISLIYNNMFNTFRRLSDHDNISPTQLNTKNNQVFIGGASRSGGDFKSTIR